LGDRLFLINRYIDVLLAETERLLSSLEAEGLGAPSVPTVYIGGGTPSLLGAGIGRLLDGVIGIAGARRGGPAALAGLPAEISAEVPMEITVEANPESADAAFLGACRSRGVSRLSLGVQSFNERSRRAVGRGGDTGDLVFHLAEAAEIFGSGLSVDLMTGLPFQTEAVLKADLERVLVFAPGHISLYSLTVEDGTPLGSRKGDAALLHQAGPRFPPMPSPDEADRLWLTGRDALEQAGYEQYEVSNFALPGKRCAHNIRYWRMENWLGAGPSASGTIIRGGPLTGGCSGKRISYGPDTEAFLSGPLPLTEYLDRNTLIRESLLMGFRYREGPDTNLFKRRFGTGVEQTIPRTLEAWRKKRGPGGKALAEKERPALSGAGLALLNPFLLDAFAELES
jgi:oxygen-independent coproporphyrinogen-3 oxidase